MLYSGAKGTMTPNNRLQRTAMPRCLNWNVSLLDSGRRRLAAVGRLETFGPSMTGNRLHPPKSGSSPGRKDFS